MTTTGWTVPGTVLGGHGQQESLENDKLVVQVRVKQSTTNKAKVRLGR